jgi:threonine dehydrogenase-like Zn-dependent dehydrogenase
VSCAGITCVYWRMDGTEYGWWFGGMWGWREEWPGGGTTTDNRGLVDRVGPEVTHLKPGDKVVVSFQIACGTCRYCKKKLSSMCDKTNNSSLMASMYGQRDAGFLGYGHLTGGYPGGQAEYVRIPFGEVNCLKIPEGVTGEFWRKVGAVRC